MAAMAAARLQAVQSLMTSLGNDLEAPTLSSSERDSSLEQLKLYGRDPTNADPIFTPNGINILARHAFEGRTRSSAQGALKVLANAMLLKPAVRETLVDAGYPSVACTHLKSEGPKTWDDSFLLSRVLLLSTYAPNIDISTLLETHELAQAVTVNLDRHTAVRGESSGSRQTNPMEDMALNETLRLLFNVTYHCPQQRALFTPAIPTIIALLWRQDILPTKPLDPPFTSIVNALLNLDLADKEIQSSLCPDAASSEAQPTRVAARLVEILELALKPGVYSHADLEQLATPLVGVLTSLYGAATDEVKQFLRVALLPAEKDREEVLGKGGSLGAALLRTTNDPMTPRLGDVASQLLFDLSDKDPSKFTENVGFGYASGFLAKNNIPVPPHLGTGAGGGSDRPFNPVTGQFVDSETAPDVPEMTEDEKLREAERLYELFERLKRTGVVDVQNPVEEAIRSGRFQEMDNDKNRVTEVDSD